MCVGCTCAWRWRTQARSGIIKDVVSLMYNPRLLYFHPNRNSSLYPSPFPFPAMSITTTTTIPRYLRRTQVIAEKSPRGRWYVRDSDETIRLKMFSSSTMSFFLSFTTSPSLSTSYHSPAQHLYPLPPPLPLPSRSRTIPDSAQNPRPSMTPDSSRKPSSGFEHPFFAGSALW